MNLLDFRGWVRRRLGHFQNSMILSSLWYHSGILGFLHVKFIADFRTMVMACSGHQFGLCRQFTYRTIILPTLGYMMKVCRGPHTQNIWNIDAVMTPSLTPEDLQLLIESIRAAMVSSTPMMPPHESEGKKTPGGEGF